MEDQGCVIESCREQDEFSSLFLSNRFLIALWETVQAGVFIIHEKTRRIVEANPRALSLTGRSRQEVIGRVCHDFICPSQLGQCPVADLGQNVDQSEQILLHASGRPLPILKSISQVTFKNDRFLLDCFLDLSKVKQSEEILRQSERQLKLMVQTLTTYTYTVTFSRNRPARTYHGTGCQILTGFSPQEYEANPNLWLMMVHPEDRSRVLRQTEAVAEEATCEPLEHRILHKDGSIRWIRNTPMVEYGENGNVQAITGLIVDITEKRESQQRMLLMNTELEEMVQQRTEQLERLTEELAEAREHEYAIGAQIQQTLLMGKPPQGLRGFDIAALTLPFRGIDGDFYDFFVQKKNCVDLLFGDVMGKGIPAALLGAATKGHFQRAMLRLVTSGHGSGIPTPEEIVGKVHAEMTPQVSDLESFICLHFGRFDLHDHTLKLVNCGHTQVMHFQAISQECTFLSGANSPLGINPREIYRQSVTPIQPGDAFLFYSDGLPDTRNPDGEFYGIQRLADHFLAIRHLKPKQLIRELVKEVRLFSGSEACHREFPWDDLSLILVVVKNNTK